MHIASLRASRPSFDALGVVAEKAAAVAAREAALCAPSGARLTGRVEVAEMLVTPVPLVLQRLAER
jgi:hypothetical protein